MNITDDSGKDPIDHFIKQRRNIVLLCLGAILYHDKEIGITSKLLEINIGKNLYHVKAAFLLALVYLSLRYYQAMLQNDDYKKLKQKLIEARDHFLLWRKGIYVDVVKEGRSELANREAEYGPIDFEDIKIRKIITIDEDMGGSISIKEFRKKESLTGLSSLWQKVLFKFYTFISFCKFSFRDVSVLEYYFPFLLIIVSFLEIFDFHAGQGVINIIASSLEGLNEALGCSVPTPGVP